jgi:hypothetical protein
MASICCWPPDNEPAAAFELGEQRKPRVDPLEVVFPVPPASLGVGAHLEILEHGERRKHLPAFGHVREPAMRARRRLHRQQVGALEADRSRQRRDDAGDGLEQGRLAGAVRTDDGDELARVHTQDDVAQHGHAAVPGTETFDLKHLPSSSACRGMRRSRPDCA